MLLSSFDNGSFIIPTLKDSALSEVHLIQSKIPLISLTWKWRGAKLLNILDYQTNFIDLSSYGKFFITLSYLGGKTNQMNTPFGYHLCLLVWGQQSPVVCFLESSQLKQLE
jgi:hypothetical protein